MSTRSTPTRDTTKRFKTTATATRGGCFGSQLNLTKTVTLCLPLTTSRTSAITGFRTVLNHRASVQ